MYRVIEVAEVLGVSKVTIYKKIEQLKPEIIAHIKTEEGVTYVSDFGVNLIKNTIKRKKTRKPRDKALLKVVDLNCELTNSKEELQRLENEIKTNNIRLKEDLVIRNRYLETIINNKTRELEKIEESNKEIRMAIEQANELLLLLEDKM